MCQSDSLSLSLLYINIHHSRRLNSRAIVTQNQRNLGRHSSKRRNEWGERDWSHVNLPLHLRTDANSEGIQGIKYECWTEIAVGRLVHLTVCLFGLGYRGYKRGITDAPLVVSVHALETTVFRLTGRLAVGSRACQSFAVTTQIPTNCR